MKIVRMSVFAAAMCWAAALAYGQQETATDPSAPQIAGQGQEQDQQTSQNAQSTGIDAQQGQPSQSQSQLAPPEQQGQPGEPQHQQHHRMTAPSGQAGEPGMADEQQRGVLGVMIIESGGPGVAIREVMEGSAAAAAGLEPGDVILQINGQGVDSPPQVIEMIRGIPAGQQATLNIWRDGQEQEISATLQAAQRDRYRVGFRGSEGASMNGDAAARIQRLESQLAAVLQELQQLRQEVMQLRTARGAEPGAATGAETPFGLDATQPGLEQPDATQPGLEEPDATQPGLEEPDATQPGLEETPAEPGTTATDPTLPF